MGKILKEACMNPINSLSNLPLIKENISLKTGVNKLLKVSAVVLPVFTALQILSSLPTTNAGFICFTLCMSSCSAATGGAFIPACVAACTAACATNPV